MSEEKLKLFIERSRKRHGDKFDYSKVSLTKMKDYVIIICNECGEQFEQLAINHYGHGSGCRKCSTEKMGINNRKSQKEFIQQCNNKHGDLYDYKKVIYTTGRKYITIICNKCGIEFKQNAHGHLNGKGCRKCKDNQNGIDKMMPIEQFISRSKELYGDKWDFSQMIYTGLRKNIKIRCINCKTKKEVRAVQHLNGSLCSFCRKMSMGEEKCKEVLTKMKIDILPQQILNCLPRKRYDFIFSYRGIKYILEYDGEQHFFESNFYKQTTLLERRTIDLIKTSTAIKEGYRIIRIDYKIKLRNIEELINKILNASIEWNLFVSNNILYHWLLTNNDIIYNQLLFLNIIR